MKNGSIVNDWGNECWYKDDKLHREDVPAVIWNKTIKQWWLHNIVLTKEEWWEALSEESKMKAIFNGEGA